MSLAAGAKFAQPLRMLCETAYRQNQVVIAAAGRGRSTMTGTSFATPDVSGGEAAHGAARRRRAGAPRALRGADSP